MINNRQQGGRRRGRGGQRDRNVGGQPGNRTDNRQRGNAAQLLEKYKNMARDAQLAGDRVQTEYYLQYADHYHRVLGENRPRHEDQRPQRGDEFDDEDGDDEMIEAAEEQTSRSDERSPREERPERAERPNRRPRERRPRDADEQIADGDGEDFQGGPRMNGSGETIAFDVLPPAIGREPEALDGDAAEEVEPRRPRRRTRAARPADGEDEIAPAA
ncbi:MAG: Eukaryotic translation initiation factor 3 subunit 10 [uncultured Sphingomonas sp.]|uniref:Eukaryotic translation initiation factor 3 subunit 10 n=1 Tax=uncultured Sphingomonas sp. TaxID=158754 RepID=A0A6J4T7M0_9SPHN|nr:MAG: Eukaryotic translation initiation factor 3 subunit 10 [uncultured Sphingomonas sp.]